MNALLNWFISWLKKLTLNSTKTVTGAVKRPPQFIKTIIINKLFQLGFKLTSKRAIATGQCICGFV